MTGYVVDTNVAVVANGAAQQAGPQCIAACIHALQRVRQSIIVLDDGMRIIEEYIKSVGLAGQPGMGHMFVKWAFDNQAVPSRCERVTIHATTSDGTGFREFPNDKDLAGFDPDDRKFVAVAAASANAPVILNAVDSDWWDYRAPLQRHGIGIRFLCPEQFNNES